MFSDLPSGLAGQPSYRAFQLKQPWSNQGALATHTWKPLSLPPRAAAKPAQRGGGRARGLQA